jgi:hypothetical protein
VVTDDQASTLRQCKAEIIRLLTEAANDSATEDALQDQFEERAAFLEYDCGLSRDEAERQARAEMAPPEPAYVGHDWGMNDPFTRFRRCPDLLRSEGVP